MTTSSMPIRSIWLIFVHVSLQKPFNTTVLHYDWIRFEKSTSIHETYSFWKRCAKRKRFRFGVAFSARKVRNNVFFGSLQQIATSISYTYCVIISSTNRRTLCTHTAYQTDKTFSYFYFFCNFRNDGNTTREKQKSLNVFLTVSLVRPPRRHRRNSPFHATRRAGYTADYTIIYAQAYTLTSRIGNRMWLLSIHFISIVRLAASFSFLFSSPRK